MKHPINIITTILTINIILLSVPAMAESNTTYLECNVPGLEDYGVTNFSVRINKNLETVTHSNNKGAVYNPNLFITSKSLMYKFRDNFLVTINRKNLSASILFIGEEKNGKCNKVKIGNVKI